MKFFPFPLLPFTISLALGIIFNAYFQPDIKSIGALLIVFGVAVVVSFFRAKRIFKPDNLFGITACTLAFTVGIGLHYIHFQPNSTNHYSHYIQGNEAVSFSGTVVSHYKSTPKNEKTLLKINQIEGRKTFGKLIVYNLKTNNLQLNAGDEITGKAEFIPFTDNANPYQFNYSRYLRNQNIFHQVFLKPNDFKLVKQHHNFDYFLHRVQQLFVTSFDQHHWEEETTAVTTALIFGYRNLISNELNNAYTDAGVVHILAISGMHIGVLYVLFSFLLRPLSQTKGGLFWQFVTLLLLLWSFAFVAGFTPSVVRAVAMFSVISLGNAFNRSHSNYNTLAASALLLLLCNPNYLFDIGFQLSYAAVLGIMLFNPFFSTFYISENRVVRYITDLITVSLAAQIGVLPLSLFYFNQFSALFLVANLLVIPLTTLILLIGIAVLILNFVCPPLAVLLGKSIECMVLVTNGFTRYIADFDSFLFQNISFTALLCFLLYGVTALLIYALYSRKSKTWYYFLTATALFQTTYLVTKLNELNRSELIVYNSKNGLITIKNRQNITAYTRNPEAEFLQRYKTGTFAENISLQPPLKNFVFKTKKIMVIDSLGLFKISQNPDIVVLTENTKINLDRLISTLKPKIIVADNSHQYYKLKKWKTTAKKHNTPFHATAEQGFFIIK